MCNRGCKMIAHEVKPGLLLLQNCKNEYYSVMVARNYYSAPQVQMNNCQIQDSTHKEEMKELLPEAPDSTHSDEYIEPIDTVQRDRAFDRSLFYSSSLPQRMHKSPTYETLIGIEEMD